jgi:ABC-type cobalamin/Fe3+-siderophores transport system ATPase subunit
LSCAVEVSRVSVSYREHLALHDVSLSIHRGEFAGIIGPNGAGKTTLLTVINGLGRIHSGTVSIMDQPATRSDFTRLRRRIGYVQQRLAIDPRAPISCFDAVILGRFGRVGLFRSPSRADHEAAEKAMELTHILHLRDRPVGRVSGGEAQKVSLARALAQEPDILLLDEPTANLDPAAVKEILELIADAHRRLNLTTVMVTHQQEQLPGICNRVVMMKQARIVFSGTRAEALRPELLSALYDHAA